MEAFQLFILFIWSGIFASIYYFCNQEKIKMSMNKHCKKTSEYTIFVDLGCLWLIGRFLSYSYFVVLKEF